MMSASYSVDEVIAIHLDQALSEFKKNMTLASFHGMYLQLMLEIFDMD